jgi:hypothetical protein
MEVNVIEEAGFLPALMGLGLSHGLTADQPPGDPMAPSEVEVKLRARARALAVQEGGHNKFLESIQIWLDVLAPRYWWQEFDTYRIGVTKQSGSTMHTITRRLLKQTDFVLAIPSRQLEELNSVIRRWQTAKEIDLCPEMHFLEIKRLLPEGYLQRRIVNLNYKALRGVYWQRRTHRLPEWQFFLTQVLEQIESPTFITSERKPASNA